MVVNPTRSANRMVTKRRSAALGVSDAWAAGVVRAGVATAPAAVWPGSACPHSAQNLGLPSYGVPQFGQAVVSARPHSPQNFWPAWVSDPHRGQGTR